METKYHGNNSTEETLYENRRFFMIESDPSDYPYGMEKGYE